MSIPHKLDLHYIGNFTSRSADKFLKIRDRDRELMLPKYLKFSTRTITAIGSLLLLMTIEINPRYKNELLPSALSHRVI